MIGRREGREDRGSKKRADRTNDSGEVVVNGNLPRYSPLIKSVSISPSCFFFVFTFTCYLNQKLCTPPNDRKINLRINEMITKLGKQKKKKTQNDVYIFFKLASEHGFVL